MTSNPAFELGPMDDDATEKPSDITSASPETSHASETAVTAEEAAGDVASAPESLTVRVDLPAEGAENGGARQKHPSGPPPPVPDQLVASPHTPETETKVPLEEVSQDTPTPSGTKPAWFSTDPVEEKTKAFECKWFIVTLVIVLVSFVGLAVLCWYGQTQNLPEEVVLTTTENPQQSIMN